jgi:hypothetical protein
MPFNTGLHRTESSTNITGVEETITYYTYLCQESRFVIEYKFELYGVFGLKRANVEWKRFRRTALHIENQQQFVLKSSDQDFIPTSSLHNSEVLVFVVRSYYKFALFSKTS